MSPWYPRVQQWLSMLWSVTSTCLFLCGQKTLNWADGEYGSQEVEEWELCIDWRGCCQQRRAFCPDSWPDYFRVTSWSPSRRLLRVPAVFHMTSNTSHSSALISRSSLTPTHTSRRHHLPTQSTYVTSGHVSPQRRRVSIAAVWCVNIRPELGLLSTAESWGLMETKASAGVLNAARFLGPRVTEDHHH